MNDNFTDLENTVAKSLDHTNLNPCATSDDMAELCRQASVLGTASVCVPPCYVSLARVLLEKYYRMDGLRNKAGRKPKVCTVIGFPLGYESTESKQKEIEYVSAFSDEVDIVINQAMVKNGFYDDVQAELLLLAKTAKERGVDTVKVIVETCNLTEEEKIRMCQICMNTPGVDYIKTSTGFGKAGAQLEDIRLWSKMIQEQNSSLKIKASGGIHSVEEAVAFLEAGASRIGASQVGKEILKNHIG